MFEDTINNIVRTEENFSGSVKDSFGKSIVSDVLEPIESEEKRLHYEYEMAEAKIAQIKAMTVQLRLIV